ncbi:MAG: preprotein translocase subunit SecA [Candidatus Bipolaricaulota bacterium]|nr:preprotein translocase subunit SecA [Candidatus Bipolaricaulota bacterium]MCS7273922.1 preprotein translocase subunit SecA [Candidatus Bipolaricaulota bacterium]MDW8110791.1 preprotein translocase subunit SecA [Candidatus Bipolaricaulota bacterium]MDW8328728.1 preprotein translocase subunit SecA [Candidatus Bipolaricaulota bacterium]
MDWIKHAIDWIFGETNAQRLKKIQPIVDRINALEPEIQSLSDAQLRAKTDEFKERLSKGETLDDILPEAFAVVREVARRKVGLRPFDVQLIGGVVIHQGKIAEMKTGEGKTLVATMPAYLNALVGKVHIVTVNDYLAKRDREWMGPIYEALGLRVGLLQESSSLAERKAAYQCDIIYGTNAQFGFDYLRDNLVISLEQRVQTGLDFAIVDEIDNILIDEARTPLIISGSTSETVKLYKRFAAIAPRFEKNIDFEIDEKARRVHMTEAGIKKAEAILKIENLYSPEHVELVRHLETALRALHLYQRNDDYIVKDGKVVIVDEFTGRLMPDRRWSDGLHQAIEAKEGLEIRKEQQTLATITLQHYFKLYKKLAGMTGTAATEEEEFKQIYGLSVVVIPTHKPMIRQDLPDRLFTTEKAKFHAIVEEVYRLHQQGRPVLIGTTSIEKSEYLSALLSRRGLKHNVLNAKHHEREAEIIKDAGQKGAITVATNMAGRGVDIKLGEGVAELGGLHIIGAQRHESRRIDDQLRGRAGRQGDPGSSQFYISLEDDLIRLFGDNKLLEFVKKGMAEGEALEHPMLTKAIRNAQKRVEVYYFGIRKRLLEYDQVMARQREAIYSLRNRFLIGSEGEDLDEYLSGLLESYTERLIARYLSGEETDLAGLHKELLSFQNAALEFDPNAALSSDEWRNKILDFLMKNYRAQAARLGPAFPQIARFMILNLIDENWRQHLFALDELQDAIGWRAYGGRDPLLEFKRESFQLFQELLSRIEEQVIAYLIKPQLRLVTPETPGRPLPTTAGERLVYRHDNVNPFAGNSQEKQPTKVSQPRRVAPHVGRNDPCPCGSGKKYKQCCMLKKA